MTLISFKTSCAMSFALKAKTSVCDVQIAAISAVIIMFVKVTQQELLIKQMVCS